MIKILPFLLILLITFPVRVTASPAVERNATSYTFVPLRFSHGYPIVKFTIYGKQIPLNLDLGASKIDLAINPKLLKQLHIKVNYTGKFQKAVDARGVKSIYKEFILPKAQLGNFIIKKIQCLEYSPWGGKGASKIGVVGLNLMARFNIIIDYKKSRIILIKGNDYPPNYNVNAWPKIPFLLEDNIITTARVGFKTIKLLWDTGAILSFIKPTVKLPGKVKTCSKKVTTYLNNCRKIYIEDFRMGNTNFGNIIFYAHSMPGLPINVDGLLGRNFFETHVIYINFTKKFLAISPDVTTIKSSTQIEKNH